ncbi:hypothetical protein BDV96DRAFT_612318 [Lophiotrema nucula]|uniref:BHLH domain-containing protein n=1 Tax=Lophiotrema nucula TaxID=690887 RepID=A0A6A5Z8J0_9PLEO|nr:hypothetical protein BDV96DRAFT_612318 [Lophiotrema nucula]
MDFSGSSSFPMVANPDYSPNNDIFSYPDAFDKAYLADAYTARPDYTLDALFDTNSFLDHPVSSVERSSSLASNQSFFNTPPTTATTISPTNVNSWPNSNQPPFGRIGNVNDAFAPSPTFNKPSDYFHISEATLREDSSPTPSLCGDGPQPQQRHSSPSQSPRSLKRETPEWEQEAKPKRPQKRRGRPRLDRTSTDSSINSSKARTAQRLPHNQVERKYREGLNAELERLRRAVPTLIQRDPGDFSGPPKPSKATILASAIDYIKKIEQERDALKGENEMLRGMKPAGARNR